MELSEDTKRAIIEEGHQHLNNYGGKSMEERKKKGMFFTPPELIIDMIECLDRIDPNEDYEDPCAGGGAILSALLIAGVRPEHIYCNELDPKMLEVAKGRLNNLAMKLYGAKIPDDHFRHEDALTEEAYFVKEKTFAEKFGKTKL